MEQSVKQRIADIQRGNVPAGYRKTKRIGIFPEKWSKTKIGDFIQFYNEKSTKNNQYPVLTSARSGLFFQKDYFEDQVTTENNTGYNIIPRGFFTYRSRSDDGSFYFNCNTIIDRGVISCFYPVFQFDTTKVDPNYIFICLNELLKEQVFCEVAGTSQLVLSEKTLSQMTLVLPPLEEQRRIAEILGCCDRVIALKKELIAEKKKQKKALMQKLLNPDSGFRLPVIREKITQVHFNDICRFINGRAYSQDELLETGKYRVLRVGNLFTSDIWYFSNLELPNDKYCQKDDLLYAWSASFGPFIWQGEATIYHYHIWKVEPCEHVDKMFLYHCLKYDAELLENSIQGGTMSHITKETMERRLCPFVDNLDLQKNIADILSAADKEIDLLEQELSQQEQKKKSLMQLLLTGIVRV